jgi:hypothetical protein
VLLLYLATAAGHISSSDGHTMYLLTQSLVERGDFSVETENTERGPDGRRYPKAGLGQALASVPFYLVGRAVASGLEPALRPFAAKAATSLVSPFAGALTALLLFCVFRALGLASRQGVLLAALAAFATPLWVYGRLYLAESLLAMGLALELYGVLLAGRGGAVGAGLATGAGFGLVVLTKYALLPAAALLGLGALPALKRPRFLVPAGLVALGFLALALFYNHARTGDLLGSGYGRQGTWAAFTTPLPVGLYGLLLSSGKGLLWFAPVVALAVPGFLSWRRREPLVALAALAAASVTIVLFAGFEHWAGDGSWGPRYLVPLLPLLVAAAGALLAEPGRSRRGLWWAAAVALGFAGAAVQKGGVFVAVGAAMREAGDYPYARALSDPRFLSDSHWNPYFSPIAVHWRLLARNAREHVSGRWPRLHLEAAAGAAAAAGSAAEARHGLGPQAVESLTHALDVWPAYALYAGRSPVLLAAVWSALLVLGLAALALAWREAGRAPPSPAGGMPP